MKAASPPRHQRASRNSCSSSTVQPATSCLHVSKQRGEARPTASPSASVLPSSPASSTATPSQPRRHRQSDARRPRRLSEEDSTLWPGVVQPPADAARRACPRRTARAPPAAPRPHGHPRRLELRLELERRRRVAQEERRARLVVHVVRHGVRPRRGAPPRPPSRDPCARRRSAPRPAAAFFHSLKSADMWTVARRPSAAAASPTDRPRLPVPPTATSCCLSRSRIAVRRQLDRRAERRTGEAARGRSTSYMPRP